MYTKPLPPVLRVSDSSPPFDLLEYLKGVRKVVQDNLRADARRPLPDQEFCGPLGDLLDEVCCSITLVEEQWEAEPEDEFGEPPLTSDEIHTAAWKEHLEAHS